MRTIFVLLRYAMLATDTMGLGCSVCNQYFTILTIELGDGYRRCWALTFNEARFYWWSQTCLSGWLYFVGHGIL